MERKEYSLAEVAQHNGNGGQRLWLVIAGGVYDVTDYAAEVREMNYWELMFLRSRGCWG